MKTKSDRYQNPDVRLWGTPEQEAHIDWICGGTRSECAQRVAREEAAKLASGYYLKVDAMMQWTREFEARVRSK